jgi:hypothetical protein
MDDDNLEMDLFGDQGLELNLDGLEDFQDHSESQDGTDENNDDSQESTDENNNQGEGQDSDSESVAEEDYQDEGSEGNDSPNLFSSVATVLQEQGLLPSLDIAENKIESVDERRVGFKTRTIIFDFADLDAPSMKFIYSGPTNAIDHNGYVKGNIYYLANYTAGVRFIDITGIGNGTMTETGYFDTYPTNDLANFDGVWNVFPYLKSGNIIISDINSGLFVVRKSGS